MEHADPSGTGHFRLREKVLTPSNLRALPSPTQSHRVDLAWNASAESRRVAEYDVFRNGSRLARLGSVSSFSDTEAQIQVTSQYLVRAFDADGYLSFPSNTAAVTLFDSNPPTAPPSSPPPSALRPEIAIRSTSAGALPGTKRG